MPFFSQDNKIRVGVLRGGPSHEYDVSLESGGHVLSLLRKMSDIYEPVDIFISRDGDWHYLGMKQPPYKIIMHTDIIWNALHGAYGEDGKIQKILQALHIPFTGSLAVPSALTMNKEMAKDIFVRNSLLTPQHKLITKENFNDETLNYIFENYLHPVIVKPSTNGSSFGISLAYNPKDLKDSIKKAFDYSRKVLVEEHIRGKEVSCGIINNARGEKVYALMPVGDLSVVQNKNIEQMAKKAHEVLGLRHYSQSDFIITPKGNIYILETDSQPSFTKNSILHQSLLATGWQPKDFIHHVVMLVLGK